MVWKVTKAIYKGAKIIEKELTHNGGQSVKDYTKASAEEIKSLQRDIAGVARVVGGIVRDDLPPLKALVGRVTAVERGQDQLTHQNNSITIRLENIEAGHRHTDAPLDDLIAGDTVAIVQTREAVPVRRATGRDDTGENRHT